MILTDTHTHQYYEQDDTLLKEKMQRCFENNITRLFLPNVDADSIKLIDNLVEKYPDNCFAMIGLHPCDVGKDYQQQLDEMKNSFAHRKIYAIGEIGIDLYWDKTTLGIQQDAFEKQILWAKELNMPIVIHCREAFDEVFEMLYKHADESLYGIFHCFTGSYEQAQKAIELGFYLGIGGVVTYKNSGLGEVISMLDIKNLVLETDSPYLTPVPFRGKPNESSYLIYVAQKIADLKQMSIEEVAEITTQNSKKVFGV